MYYSRYKWKRLRKRFVDLSIAPILDYREYCRVENDGAAFRFTGEIESITDEHVLWLKGSDLTISVPLEKTTCFLLQKHDKDGGFEALEQIKWNLVSTLTEVVRVYIGGHVNIRNNRLNFVSTKKMPLIVIFYNCPDTELTDSVIHAARGGNDYWNSFTPISLSLGAVSLIYIAASLSDRPAFYLVVVGAMLAVFVPVLPVIPPGLLLTFVYRRLSWHSRQFRAYRDFAHLPLRYLRQGEESCILSTGEKYGYVKINSPVQTSEEIPVLMPGNIRDNKKREWYFFGVIDKENLPVRSADPFVSFGVLPANYVLHPYRFTAMTYTLEVLSWIVLLLGVLINVIFVMIILSTLGIV
jgi:hypothetical protein